jgi:hypothetical protein
MSRSQESKNPAAANHGAILRDAFQSNHKVANDTTDRSSAQDVCENLACSSRQTEIVLTWDWCKRITESNLQSTTRHVLLTLAVFMNGEGGSCFPTTETIASATGLSERSVCVHIKKGRVSGWLSVSKHGSRGQQWRKNQYQASFPRTAKGADGKSVANGKAADPNDTKALTHGQTNYPTTIPLFSIENKRLITPFMELREALDEPRARAVINHRKQLGKPLKAYDAKLLTVQFSRCPEPNSAADIMISKGWKWFDVNWLAGTSDKGAKGGGSDAHPKDFAELLRTELARDNSDGRG